MEIFFGSDRTPDDCERIALMRITPELRQRESHLFTTKWFDYRHMHPVIATYYYAECYKAAVKLMHRSTKDYREAETLQVLDHDDIFIPPPLGVPLDVCFWKARQAADSVCVPYDFALNFTMRRASARGWKVNPRPNQLYAEELTLDIRDGWNELLKASFQTAKSPRFRLDRYNGHPDQAAYHAWLLQACSVRESPASTLSRCMREGQMNTELALTKFRPEVVQEAMRYVV